MSKQIAQVQNSVKVSHLIAGKMQNVASHPLIREFVKKYIQCTSDIICPAQKQAVTATRLLRDTIVRQTEDLSKNIFSTFKSNCKLRCLFCSHGRKYRCQKTALLATKVCGDYKNFKIMKELVALVPLKGTIMAADLYTAL